MSLNCKVYDYEIYSNNTYNDILRRYLIDDVHAYNLQYPYR